MSSGRRKEKSKNDTWGEQELAKYIGGGKDAGKKRLASTDPHGYGSPKSNPKSKSSGGSLARKDPTKVSRPSGKSDPKKSSSDAKSSLESSTKRESKPSGGQRSDGDKRREKDSKRREESKGRSKDSKGRAVQKGSNSKESDKDKGASGFSKDKHGGTRAQEPVDKRSDKAGSDRTKEDKKSSGKEEKAKQGIVVTSDPPDERGQTNEGAQPQPMVEVLEDLGEDEYQYEEEFEADYEEDFDEVAEEEEEEEGHSSLSEDNGERAATPTNADVTVTPSHSKAVVMKAMDLVEIMQAMDTENQMVEDYTQPKLHSDRLHDQELHSDSMKNRRGIQASPSRKFVDFSSAQKREVSERVSKKTRKRGQELLSMIELDIVGYDMLDLPPLSEYEVYVKKFGADDTRQVPVQTGEDNVECEVQTEAVQCVERWTQWPPEDLKGYGGPTLDSDDSGVANEVSRESALRLTSFLTRAGQVCTVLLEENLLCAGTSSLHSTQSQFPFCSSSLTIESPAYLSECHVTGISHSPSQPHLFLATYATAAGCTHTQLYSEGVVTVWNNREPSQPQMVLVCQSRPTCACFSPHKSSLVFAGNSDGSVVLWDLREPVSMHSRQGGMNLVTRVPTFSTAGIPHLDNHQAPIVCITPISADTPSHSLLSTEEVGSTGLSFQLATLDSAGQLHLWVVVEVFSPDPHGTDSDLGLVPMGRVKLVKSSSLNVTNGPTYCLQFRPGDTNHLYVGCDVGCTEHRTRYGRRPIPKTHTRLHESGTCDVLSISFCPWQPDLFLAGHSDGSLSLYHINRAHPLLSWSHCVGGCVSLVQWIQHRPGVFLVWDSLSTIHLWDLLKNDAEPVYKHSSKEKFTALSLNLSHSIPHNVTTSPTHTTHNPPTLTLAHVDGSLVIHQLKDSGKTANEEKLSAFENYVNSIM